MRPPLRAEQLTLPPEYGTPSRVLDWDEVRRRLEESAHYWFASVTPVGRPHVVPLDGIWLEDRWYFGGSRATIRHRNLSANPQATLHLEDAQSAVIVEGRCAFEKASQETADRLASASISKYGYAPPSSAYVTGVWVLSPTRVLAWSDLTADATRFVFD
jgi:nitroimidazol reductase NimA-like FMN-containing flavoprotein (pyridoxamine 5'-phosphate oxidase superfamily)